MGTAHRLTALGVKNLKPATRDAWHADGAGLYLLHKKSGGKSWAFRFMQAGKPHWLGLGAYPDVGLADARDKAQTYRKLAREGTDLAEHHKANARPSVQASVTFNWCAAEYIKLQAPKWANAKSEQQWANTLATYASPSIGKLDVSKVTTDHIEKILTPLWATKQETASRLRARIEAVLGWATVKKYRSGDNPARLAGHLATILPARNKSASVKHHAALPYKQMAEFMAMLRTREGIAARACEFTILTAARSGEARGATWSEIDLEAGLWTIPASRMKVRKEHRVPMSKEALQVLESMKPLATGALIFPGTKSDKPLSDMSLTAVLKRAGHAGVTMHGFRSSFRDWAAEATDYPSEMAEMALAHAVGNKVEAAYRRGDLMEKRREMMQAWSGFCGGAHG